MRKLYFIRHGQSTLNALGLFSGHSDPPLTPLGRDQAKKAGQEAIALNIDLIVSSPLSRALTTAQIIATEVRYPHEKIITHEALMERNFGTLEKQPYRPQMHVKHTEFEAETDDLLIERAKAVHKWLQEQPAEIILVVGHGGIGRALRYTVKPEADFYEPLANASLVRWL